MYSIKYIHYFSLPLVTPIRSLNIIFYQFKKLLEDFFVSHFLVTVSRDISYYLCTTLNICVESHAMYIGKIHKDLKRINLV